MNNDNFLDALSGVANYEENLTQSDKDDIMKSLDQQTNDILLHIENSLEEQNKMLLEILSRLK